MDRDKSLRRLSNLMKRVDRGLGQSLNQTARPTDPYAVDVAPVTEPEVHRAARLGEVAARGTHLAHHHLVPDPESNYRADRIAVALGSRQSEFHVVLTGKPIREKIRAIIEIVGHDVESAVAVEVGNRGAPRASCSPLTPDICFLVDATRRWLDAK